ncbi:hypothetical protein BX666DRAFT_1170210 [Dichotomocladium elegans]|nr:hypothetical protein BX666DRAFT_1170210 [Dichotomocladium elegans]
MRHINDSVTLECVLPKIDETPRSISRRNNLFIYVNRRPINHVASELKEIAIMYRKYYCEAVSVKEREYSTLNPFFYLDIQLCPDQYEVNFDPRKSVILLHKKERILSAFEELMIMAYGSLIGEERLDNQLKRKSMAPAESARILGKIIRQSRSMN